MTVSVIVSILGVYGGFKEIDEEKIKMLEWR
jgi:hypothetical protein